MLEGRYLLITSGLKYFQKTLYFGLKGFKKESTPRIFMVIKKWIFSKRLACAIAKRNIWQSWLTAAVPYACSSNWPQVSICYPSVLWTNKLERPLKGHGASITKFSLGLNSQIRSPDFLKHFLNLSQKISSMFLEFKNSSQMPCNF